MGNKQSEKVMQVVARIGFGVAYGFIIAKLRIIHGVCLLTK